MISTDFVEPGGGQMKRCTNCILPENYLGITFNDEGICNHCSNYKEREYLGGDALKREIEQFLHNKRDRNKDYDCVVGFSGGRDSSYILYYLKKILNLRVVAYSADNGFIPEQAKLNMKNITDTLNIKLVIEKHDYLKKCIKHTALTWMHRPSLPMIETFCTGCRLGVNRGILNFVQKNKIPLIIYGGTPFEHPYYRVNLIKLNPYGGNRSMILGYLCQIIRNPRWIMNATYLDMQIKEYFYFFTKQKIAEKSGMLRITPFMNYIHWKEKDIISTLEDELNWQKNPTVASTWRGDCDIALLKLYVYKNVLGYNDKIDNFSHLIRDGQLTREEALARLSKEEEVSENAIKEICDNLELNYMDFKTCVAKCSIK